MLVSVLCFFKEGSSDQTGCREFRLGRPGSRGIQNRLHSVLDVVLRDDLARPQTSHGPQNTDVIKHAALNLLCKAKPAISTKDRGKRAGWNPDYLATLIQRTALGITRFPWISP